MAKAHQIFLMGLVPALLFLPGVPRSSLDENGSWACELSDEPLPYQVGASYTAEWPELHFHPVSPRYDVSGVNDHGLPCCQGRGLHSSVG